MNNYLNPNLTAADNVLARQQIQMPIQPTQMPVQQQPQQIQMQAPQQMFIQPSGSVYQLNSSTEIDMVPVGNQMISIGLCMNEGVLQIKTLQNGIPMIVAYQLAPINAQQLAEQRAAKQKANSSLEERITKIEELLTKNATTNKGADVSWQI
jgi:hypothetical protein